MEENELHTLDSNLRRDTVIEGYESFIWAERYFGWGDIELKTKATYESRALFQTGLRLGMQGSYRVMIVETVTDSVDEEGKKILVVNGRSMEKILDDRVAMPALAGLAATPKWVVTGLPAAVARYIFAQICVNCVLSAYDAIPFYHSGTFLPAGTIDEPDVSVSIEFDPASVYSDIQQVCLRWLLGFRLVKDGDTGNVYFDIYTGRDRTSKQSAEPAVIFSADMETIDKTSMLKSIATQKTAAYVFARNGALMVYADGYDSSVSGDARRILLVNADDIDEAAGETLNALMAQRGADELAKYRSIYALDGEIPQYQPFKYGTDYNLGDLVELRSEGGYANVMMVTEQIFISDAEGKRSYPTLMLYYATITPGSWAALPGDEHWDDAPVDQHWDDA